MAKNIGIIHYNVLEKLHIILITFQLLSNIYLNTNHGGI